MKKFIEVGQLPENPFEMPPPYWRSPGIILQLTISLEELCNLLRSLLELHPKINGLISEYFEKYPNPDDDNPEFGDICDPLWRLEANITLKSEIAVFMAGVDSEDHLNRIITYNLHKDIADSIEKLSPPEKLLIISAILTGKSVKGYRPYEVIKNLSRFRNSYAHGHCADRPIKTLRHNHLISPEEHSSVPKAIGFMVEQLKGYLDLANYLQKISKNDYTASGSTHDDEIEKYLNNIERYCFSYKDEGTIYSLKYM